VKPVVPFPTRADTASQLRRAFDRAPRSLTIGAEEELMLVRSESGDLAACAEEVLSRASGDARFVAELRASQIEIVTRPSLSAADLGRELAASRCDLSELVAPGVLPLAAGAHPNAAAPGRITDGKRYRAIAADHPWAARDMLTCGLHVHVGIAGGDRALAAYNALRGFLPELCALAANSPFQRSEDAGVASVRTLLNRFLPRSGAPPVFGSWAELARYVDWGARGGSLPDPSYQWWGLRLHPGVGTLELRMFDTQTEVEDAVALAAFAQALVAWVLEQYDGGEQLPVHEPHLIDENLYLAARDATGGWLVDLESGERQPTVDRIEHLLDEVAPYARALGSERELARTAALAWIGGAERQRLFVEEHGIDALPGWLSVLTHESARRVRAEALSPLAGQHAPGRMPRDDGAAEALVGSLEARACAP
jgi:glutamate---cysteine ligase / carboxylate-amine ligase